MSYLGRWRFRVARGFTQFGFGIPSFLIPLLVAVSVSWAGAQSYTFTTLAGNLVFSDGPADRARFLFPTGVGTDDSNNIYVADYLNNAVRKITLLGTNAVVATLAGIPGAEGTNDGPSNFARFKQPTGVAVDRAGNAYVADYQNATVRKITAAGLVSTLAGLPGVTGTNDGTGSSARFNRPYGVAVDNATNVYVADSANHTIRKMTPAGLVSTLAGLGGVAGTNNGTGSAARFSTPAGVAVDSSNNVYVADLFNHSVRKITPAAVVTTLAGSNGIFGTNDGTGILARFNQPSSVSLDSSNNVFVADYQNSTIRRVTPAGVVTTVAGAPGLIGSADGTGNSARFSNPIGLALDRSNTVYVADYQNYTIRKMTSGAVVSTFAGQVGGPGTNDGSGNLARFFNPNSVVADSSNNVYVADEGNNTIRKITPAGVVSTLAGVAGLTGTNDGTGSAARFAHPEGVAVDRSNDVYVADQNAHTIRKVTPSGVVTTIAGLGGSPGIVDGTNSGARFNSPSDVAVDSAGNVYVTDFGSHTIRKIRPSGTNWIVTTIAGLATSPGSTNGTNSVARFSSPYGVTVDPSTNLFVADTGNNTVRKIVPAGTNWVTSTFAGKVGVTGSVDASGTNATFNQPTSITIDALGNLFVGDALNYTIRKITPLGVVSTVGGLAGATSGVDGTGSAARFSFTYGVAVDGAGNLYVADWSNNSIRKGIPTTSLSSVILQSPRLDTGHFAVGLSGPAGVRADIEAAGSLSNWQTIGSYVLENGTNYFIDVRQLQTDQFYRARVP